MSKLKYIDEGDTICIQIDLPCDVRELDKVTQALSQAGHYHDAMASIEKGRMLFRYKKS